MNHQVKGRSARHVADYFVLVGLGDDLESYFENESEASPSIFNAVIEDQYPTVKQDCSPPEGLSLFCFPTGIEITAEERPPSFHSFVHTAEDGLRMLGSCLTFCEQLTSNQLTSFYKYAQSDESGENGGEPRYYYAPRCICLISHWPFVSSFKIFLRGLYNLLKQSESCPITIPIERYICNFIDDVPAPPAGLVDVTYYLEHEAISFSCPPVNKPNIWAGLPLFPLLECLSPENILTLFSLALMERQILFVSSQYSLLTICAEAIISFMYPLTWTHAYVPILPRKLLGVLGAPCPYILGVHSSFLTFDDFVLGDETVTIFLDDNRIQFNSSREEMLPPLPDKRGKKLMQDVLAAGPVFATRPPDWRVTRLPEFDRAFSSVSEKPYCKVDEEALRSGFLRYFAGLLHPYRRYLIYGSADDPSPITKFQCTAFLNEYPTDAKAFLREMIKTQSFSEFVDKRVFQIGPDPDIMFFDETIDAKKNRSLLQLRSIDTPFLLESAHKHSKTYVTPSPDLNGLPLGGTYSYRAFPRFKPELFSSPRGLSASLMRGGSWGPMAAAHMARLKRATPQQQPAQGGTGSEQRQQQQQPQSVMACTFSCYLVTLARVVCHTLAASSVKFVTSAPSTQQIIEEFACTAPGAAPEGASVARPRGWSLLGTGLGATANTPLGSTASRGEDEEALSSRRAEASKLGLKVALEALSVLSRADKPADDVVYRSLVDACGACGFAQECVDLIVHMSDEGMLPDNQMLSAVARAIANDTRNNITSSSSGGNIVSSSARSNPVAANPVRIKSMDSDDIPGGGASSDTSKITLERSSSSNQIITNGKKLNASDVWTMQDWQWHAVHTEPSTGALYRRKLHGPAAGTFSSSSAAPPPPPPSKATMAPSSSLTAVPTPTSTSTSAPTVDPVSNTSVSSLYSWFFGSSSSSSSTTSFDVPSVTSSSHSSTARKGAARPWSTSFPDLHWSNLGSEESKAAISAASTRRLSRHMFGAEAILHQSFPGLTINMSHPLGMACPGPRRGTPCPLGRPLTLTEIFQGWEVGNAQKYTTQCYACGAPFVPRFTVHCEGRRWVGSDGPGTPLWCELLSPWSLRKELFGLLFEDEGAAEAIMSPRFRDPVSSPQHATLFWNTIVAFRLHGLPYSFMVCGGDVVRAFPPKPPKDRLK